VAGYPTSALVPVATSKPAGTAQKPKPEAQPAQAQMVVLEALR